MRTEAEVRQQLADLLKVRDDRVLRARAGQAVGVHVREGGEIAALRWTLDKAGSIQYRGACYSIVGGSIQSRNLSTGPEIVFDLGEPAVGQFRIEDDRLLFVTKSQTYRFERGIWVRLVRKCFGLDGRECDNAPALESDYCDECERESVAP